MLLSIGMIVKNEEKYLEKCLSALKPILENVDCELIIADTGSTDNTVEIAKKFTDKVYYFEWINDFSAARNFTMEKSVGEWYMFLDADEVFQSCDEIIRFFNSGEYKSFGSASYKIRSYSDEDRTDVYSDSVAMRLSKRYSDVKFINKVHEALSPIHLPVKMFNEIADHYGYYFRKNGKVTEQAQEKYKRNLELLLESLNGPTVDFGVYREIADCYRLVEDNENVIKYIDMGLNSLDHKQIAITQYFSAKAEYMYNIRDFKELIAVCDQYFREREFIDNKPIASDIDMYAFRGVGYFCTQNYEKAVESYIPFFRLYKDYTSGKLNTFDQIYNPMKLNNIALGTVYSRFLLSCIMLKKYNTALENLKEFPVDKFQQDRDYMLSHFRVRADIMENTGWKSVKKFIDLLDDENKAAFFRVLRKKMFYTEKPEELLKVLADFKNIIPCAEEMIGIYRSYFINNDLQYEQIKKFTEKYGSEGNVDILGIMFDQGMDISVFLNSEDFNAQKCAHDLYANYADKAILLKEYDVNKLSADALTNAASLYGWAMVETINSGKDITQIFERFGNIAAKWQSDLLSVGTIPSDISAGLIVHRITEARKNKDFGTCVSEMRNLIKDHPDFAPFVSEYRKAIEQEIMTPKDTRSELSEMAEMVKRNIRTMLDAGDISSAEKTLLELEKLCPSDAEIGMLKYHIKTLKIR